MRYAILFSLALFTALPAQAQNSGLSYTTLGAQQERTGGHMNYKKLNYGDSELKYQGDLNKDGKVEENAEGTENPKSEHKPEGEQAADQAWEKYKALAAGKYVEPEKPEAPPAPAAEPEEEKPATGLAGILEQYNKNKTQRSQMRTINVTPPQVEESPEEKEKSPDKSSKKSGD